MKTLKLNSMYGGEYEIALHKGVYLHGGNLYINLLCKTEYGWEPYSNLTVNLPENLPENQAFIDTNNNGFGITEWIKKHKLGKFTGKFGYSGFCSYPLFEFDMNEVNKYLIGGNE